MMQLEVKDEGIAAGLARVVDGYRSPRPLMRAIAGLFESETEANFEAQGRPAWAGLAPSTIKQRTKAGTWPGKILQVSGGLAGSIATDYGRDFALVGSNKVYAAIQQLGGTIERAAYSSWGALRTDRAGNLLRQGTEGRGKNLAVFAKGSHKRVKAIRYTVAAHSITIKSRPYLPADKDGNLQPTTARGIESLANDYLASLVGPRK